MEEIVEIGWQTTERLVQKGDLGHKAPTTIVGKLKFDIDNNKYSKQIIKYKERIKENPRRKNIHKMLLKHYGSTSPLLLFTKASNSLNSSGE